MVILLNGAFGIGKTSVARLVSKRLPQTSVFDPELIGFVLQRTRKLTCRPVDDFQDVALWRRLVVLGVHAATKLRRNIIVPMAFSNLSYLNEIRTGIARFEPDVRHLCLVAPIEVVEERLKRRAARSRAEDLNWQYRRAAECCIAHRESEFAEHVATDGRTAKQVADEVLARIAVERGAA